MQGLLSIKKLLFQQYLPNTKDIAEKFYGLKDAEISNNNFSFYTSVSSVFSSKIEGEEIELDSFIKHKNFGIEFQPDYTKKTDDLYEAYQFAKNKPLNKENILEAHRILSRNILQNKFRGVYRKNNMYVLTDDGKIEYVATNPSLVEKEMEQYLSELENLISEKLQIEEVFFFASCVHLLFVKIHPMNDGNGRLGRLLEKWFVAEKLGDNAWYMQSEKWYYQNHENYYKNIRKIGLEYEQLNFEKSLDFLKMFPKSLEL